MTPEERAAKVMERWHRQVVDTTTPFSGDEVLARDIAEAIREAVAERTESSAQIIPTTWLDPLLSGDHAVLPRDQRWGCPEIERLLSRLAAAIRAQK